MNPRLVPLIPYFQTAASSVCLPWQLLAAICERESGYGAYLDANLTGDNGHGRGLMQIDDRAFPDFCATEDWKDPAKNIMKGAQVLRDAIAFTQYAAGACAYNAGQARVLAAADSVTTDHNYGSDVMRRMDRLAAFSPGAIAP